MFLDGLLLRCECNLWKLKIFSDLVLSVTDVNYPVGKKHRLEREAMTVFGDWVADNPTLRSHSHAMCQCQQHL